MIFEYDRAKSVGNLDKHGIDFASAQRLWEDPRLLEVPARTLLEPRSMFIGLIDGRHWSAIATQRGTRLRLISVRRSRDEERVLYESKGI